MGGSLGKIGSFSLVLLRLVIGQVRHRSRCRKQSLVSPGEEWRGSTLVGKGQMGSALMGSLHFLGFCDRWTFWVFRSTYFYIPKSARAYFFPESVKTKTILLQGPH